MPIYTYICKDCGHKFDKLSSETIICPVCKSVKTERVRVYKTGLKFNGEGFYETDYKVTEK